MTERVISRLPECVVMEISGNNEGFDQRERLREATAVHALDQFDRLSKADTLTLVPLTDLVRTQPYKALLRQHDLEEYAVLSDSTQTRQSLVKQHQVEVPNRGEKHGWSLSCRDHPLVVICESKYRFYKVCAEQNRQLSECARSRL